MAHPNEKDAIRNLQRYLRQLSYTDKSIPPPPIDGIFGSRTAQALRAFQLSVGLPPTGVADRTTWNALYAAYRESLRHNGNPVALAQFPRLSYGYTLREGDKNFLVSMIQYALSELSLIYDGMDDVKVTGEYDAPTAAAVKEFQEKHGIPATGCVDRETWDAIADTYNRTFDDVHQ